MSRHRLSSFTIFSVVLFGGVALQSYLYLVATSTDTAGDSRSRMRVPRLPPAMVRRGSPSLVRAGLPSDGPESPTRRLQPILMHNER